MTAANGMANSGKTMNLARSIIVPDTMASDTAQNTNWNHHLADAGTVLAAIAGRSSFEPGENVGMKPLNPTTGKSQVAAAPNASAKPIAQYAIEATPKFVMTLATMVPTFFMRLKPTSSMAKPACMNITSTAATITQTVSAPTPAAAVAVVSPSAARTWSGSAVASAAITTAVSSLCLLMADQPNQRRASLPYARQPKSHGEVLVGPHGAGAMSDPNFVCAAL